MKKKIKKKSKFQKKVRVSNFNLYRREVLNYFYIKRTIKKEIKKAQTWNILKLRMDWVGRIYTVINLKVEHIGETEEMKMVRVAEEMKPINQYLNSLDMAEIIYPVIEQLSEYSFLIVYVPLFKKFTIIRTFKYLFTIFGLGFAIFHLTRLLLTLLM